MTPAAPLTGWACPGCGRCYGPFTTICWYCGPKNVSSSGTTNPTPPLEGTLPADDLRRAFVAGAKWWEWHSTKATMWASDRDLAEAEAERRYPDGQPAPDDIDAQFCACGHRWFDHDGPLGCSTCDCMRRAPAGKDDGDA